ncbi:cobalt ECF transporter T component CbiQ, cbiQ [Lactococcus lactis subsp. lactis]|nr:cobalt ECF transporter T component CbiQ, cbiQ [Lactococcus lactis subsp. lactis]
MQNMLMGRYIPGDSIIHRMDPRSKLLVMIAFVVIIFLAHDWLGYLLLGALHFSGCFIIQDFSFLFFKRPTTNDWFNSIHSYFPNAFY